MSSSGTLSRLKESVDTWRRSGQSPKRMPVELWEQSVSCARELGCLPVASALGIEAQKLKSRMLEAQKSSLSVEQDPSFFEFMPAASSPLGRCVVEAEATNGKRIRVEVNGLELPGLVTLLREFVK